MKGIVFWLLMGASCIAQGEQLTQQECDLLGAWTHDIMWARDMGADKEKVRADVDIIEGAHKTVLQRRFDELWVLTEERKAVAYKAIDECYDRRGNYGVSM